MLKIVLIIVGVIALLIVGVLVVAAMQPNDFRYERSTTINAPGAVVFPHINDFRKWGWNPWAKLDPNIKITTGPDVGEGAHYDWVGNANVGEGKMTIIESKPNDVVRIKLEFLKPFAATHTAEFLLQPDGNGTKLTWAMFGKNLFMSKVMGVFMSMEKMMGDQFDKGLADIKAAAEADAKGATS